MTGQQGAGAGQGGPPSGADQESTQVGMPVPPTPTTLRPDTPLGPPPSSYGQGGTYPAPPPPPPGYVPPGQGYGAPPGGYPPPGYGYAPPPPRRGGGLSPILIGAVALLLVVGLGVGGMYVARIGPFAAQATATPTRIADATPTPTRPAATATPTVPVATTPPSTLPPTSPPVAGSPSLPPTSSPVTETPTVGPTSSPATGDEQELLSHVPTAFVDSCTATPPLAPVLASVVCFSIQHGIAVTYSLYSDAGSMAAAYDGSRQVLAPDAGAETCSEADNWPAEYQYTIGGAPSGRVFCADTFGLLQMYWTDTRFNILSSASMAVDPSREAMYSFWEQDSGPY